MLQTQIFPQSRLSTRAILILSFALLTGIAAQVQILLPFTPVPVTLQVLAVILAGLLLGPVDGFFAMLTYLGLIAAGAPFAAGWIGGPAAFAGPTAGYLLSFPIAVAVVDSDYSDSFQQSRIRICDAVIACTGDDFRNRIAGIIEIVLDNGSQ